jgi:hypothetical protein
LHATVLPRHQRGRQEGNPTSVPPDLLDDATVLCVGRGATYPALSDAIGARVGLIGALGVDTAARYLNARAVDGVIIGEGLGSRVVEALLTMLAEDTRFRDLPVGLLNNAAVDEERLPNLVRVDADAVLLVERVLPFVRLQAFESRLQRVLKSLESKGGIDPDTGLMSAEAFWRDLERAVRETEAAAARSRSRASPSRAPPTVALHRRARLFSRLVRAILRLPRAGRIDPRGLRATDLRSAHVLARRIASVLQAHDALARRRPPYDPADDHACRAETQR